MPNSCTRRVMRVLPSFGYIYVSLKTHNFLKLAHNSLSVDKLNRFTSREFMFEIYVSQLINWKFTYSIRIKFSLKNSVIIANVPIRVG